MPRRSTKIQSKETVNDKKPVRKVQKSKKEKVGENINPNIRVKVTKTVTKPIPMTSQQEDDKATVLEQIKASYADSKKAPSFSASESKQINREFDSLAIYEREERKKIMIMWVGVAIFMTFIAGFWIYDTKKIFEQNKLAPVDAKNDFSLDELSKSVKEVSSRLEEFKQEIAKASSTATTTLDSDIAGISASSTVSSDLATSTIASSTVEETKPELIVKELQEKLITSPELSTGASTTEDGSVRGVYEERDIITELKNKLEK